MDETTTLTDTVAVALETVETAVVRVGRVWSRTRDVVARAVADARVCVVRLARPPCGGARVVVTLPRPASCRAFCVPEV